MTLKQTMRHHLALLSIVYSNMPKKDRLFCISVLKSDNSTFLNTRKRRQSLSALPPPCQRLHEFRFSNDAGTLFKIMQRIRQPASEPLQGWYRSQLPSVPAEWWESVHQDLLRQSACQACRCSRSGCKQTARSEQERCP